MFIFKDKTSDEMGLKCTQYTLRKKARRMYNQHTIPGRAEPLIEMVNTFDPVTIDVECDIMNETSLDDIFGWLNGKGILIDERYPEKYRIAQAPDRIDTVAVNDEIRTITIPFLCSAFMYSVDNEKIRIPSLSEVPTGYDLEIKGTFYSEPKIIVEIADNVGTNMVTFRYGDGGMNINLTAADSGKSIVIDGEKHLVYYEDTKEIILERTQGVFPLLDNEKPNKIVWYPSEPIKNVYVIKNERWL